MTIESPEGKVRQDTVLVVDDEEDIRQSVAQILESSLTDVDIVTAVDAEEALRCLEAGGIDLIITDFRMPGMDGLELLRRCSESRPDVPRILMTAFGDLDIAVQAINDAHVHSFFSKPFEPQEVIDTVWKVLDQHWEDVQVAEKNSHSLASLRDDDDDAEGHPKKNGHHKKK